MARQQQNPPGSRRAKREEGKPKRIKFADVRWDTPDASFEFFALPIERPEDFAGSTQDAVLLPPGNQSVSTTPSSLESVVKAHSHGLVYTTQAAMITGLGALGGLFVFFLYFGAPVVLGQPWYEPFLDVFRPTWANLFFAPLALATWLLAWILLRIDTTGYRYPAILLDRASGKLHLFFDDKYTVRKPDGLYFRKSWLWWPLWGGGACTVKSYDWACVRAQVVKARIFTGTVGREEAQLQLVITDAPGSANIVATAGVGLSTSSSVVQPLLDGWEHMRRFMAHEGPLFEGDGPNRTLGSVPLWQAPLHFQTLIGPGAMQVWKHGTTADFAVGLFLLLIIPMTALLGLSRWACMKLKSEPRWPAEVLASVGGAELRGRELDAWRSVVPTKQAASPTIAVSDNQALR